MNVIHKEKVFLEKYLEGIFKRLEKEISLLHKWFKENFKGCRLDVSVEFSKIRKTVFIRTRLFKDNEQVNMRDSFMKMIIIEEKTLINPRFMDPFLMIFNEKYREEISRLIRNFEHLRMSEVQEAI